VAVEAGKLTLYLRSMLNDMDIHQDESTTLYKDNVVAIAMARANRPTRYTSHMEIKHVVLLDWVAIDQMLLSAIPTHDNPADGFTKSLGQHLFSRHNATFLGKQQPS